MTDPFFRACAPIVDDASDFDAVDRLAVVIEDRNLMHVSPHYAGSPRLAFTTRQACRDVRYRPRDANRKALALDVRQDLSAN